jgi:hypothetical protein
MEKRSRRRVPELVTRPAFQGLSENEIGRARISIMARNANIPFKGRIQKRKTYHLQIIISACNARPVHTVSVALDRHTPAARGMSASPPIASKLWHRSEMMRGAISGLMHRGKQSLLFDHLVGTDEQPRRHFETKCLWR